MDGVFRFLVSGFKTDGKKEKKKSAKYAAKLSKMHGSIMIRIFIQFLQAKRLYHILEHSNFTAIFEADKEQSKKKLIKIAFIL